MNICKIDISNFRGIKKASILVSKNAVFVGDNNSGKSTLFEAVDLVMGPDRLSRSPVIDEHDFYAGEYLANNTPVQIKIEVTVIGLSEDQKIYFGNHIEWWDRCKGALISGPPASSTDADSVEPALRLAFQGNYNLEEDDFEGQTYFAETLREGSTPELFRKKDKRNCGFLYLRTLRTGNRALSLERGSLLDIILQMKEVKPQMWEDVLNQLKGVSVANESELGVSDILTSVQDSLSNIVSYPVIILDEFQDTSADEWQLIQLLGTNSELIALADPEQRIYDFRGADPKRIAQFIESFKPKIFDFGQQNNRSNGKDIAEFGNDLLQGKNTGKQFSDISA